MKFVCLLHESELQVIAELKEYNRTDTSIRLIITQTHTYIR